MLIVLAQNETKFSVAIIVLAWCETESLVAIIILAWGETKSSVAIILLFLGTWHQHAFFEVCVFNPLAPSNRSSTLSTTYCGGDPGGGGGSLGSGDPLPPSFKTHQGSNKNDVLLLKCAFLELNVILAVLKESNQYFLKKCTHHTPYTLYKDHFGKKSSLYM